KEGCQKIKEFVEGEVSKDLQKHARKLATESDMARHDLTALNEQLIGNEIGEDYESSSDCCEDTPIP
ncbi:27657_t:CDS:2, partial [Racocetra persica]